MILLDNLFEDDIKFIGEAIAKSFWENDCSYRKLLNYDECVHYFQAVVSACGKAGRLFTSSENQEGYLAFWHKNGRPNMIVELMKYMGKQSFIKLGKGLKEWNGFEHYYENNDDYLAVFLVVVRNEFKGQGIARKMLEYPFSMSDREKIPCFLDTDTIQNARTYEKIGMRIDREMILSNGIHMFSMAYGMNDKKC